MAEGENTPSKNENSWESWLGGWVQTAKEKSTSALEFVKKDLAEFTCTMQKDTELVVEKTKESLNKEKTAQATNKVKAGLTSFLDNLSKVLVIPPDDDYIQMKIAPDGSGLYDRGKARLNAIQLDASTYIDPPEGPPEQYIMWLESFNVDEHKGEISELLVSKVEVRALYTRLVPGEVSHAEFWQRYFYKVHQLQCDEARKQALMKRAEQSKGDSFSWDDDEEDWSGEEEDNHSDWEKMPRPPQSASRQTNFPEKVPVCSGRDQQGKTQHVINKDVDEPCKPAENKAIEKDSNLSSTPAPESSVAVPAESNKSPEIITELGPGKANDGTENCSEADKDLGYTAHINPPATDLWSLHIPDDDAGAVVTEQDSVEQPTCSAVDSQLQQTQQRLSVSEPEVSAVRQGTSSSSLEDNLPVHATATSGLVTSQHSIPHCSPASSDETGPVESTASTKALPEVVPEQPAPQGAAGDSCVGAPATTSESASASTSYMSVDPETSTSDVIVDQLTPAPDVIVDRLTPAPDVIVDQLTPAPDVIVDQSTPAPDVIVDRLTPAPDVTVDQLTPAPDVIVDQLTPAPDVIVDQMTEIPVESLPADDVKNIGMTIKGDMVVVGENVSPTSSETSDHKEMSSSDLTSLCSFKRDFLCLLPELGQEDDWEDDFDIEVTEDDLKVADDIAKRLGENLNVDDDWENWE
ncbi:BSD domain-containing protein 1-like isoform X3 [Physella acuta]|uniref:BSD domain-containing protein 1-like isoform X3 n=1 Tax=Physella acuta TaxID=109671 RepID=UPI0027DE17D0|nr:BSD domain-containing protein 1-like isoform X3 [Physella acuta]